MENFGRLLDWPSACSIIVNILI